MHTKSVAASLQLRSLEDASDNVLHRVLSFLWQNVASDEREGRIESILSARRTRGAKIAGSCCLWRGNKIGSEIVGGMFVEHQTPGLLTLWAPVATCETAVSLLRSCLEKIMQQHSITTAMMILDNLGDTTTPKQFGFDILSPLVSLVCDVLPNEIIPTRKLVLAPLTNNAEYEYKEIAALVEKTYEDSCDFPAMLSHCTAEQIVSGYRVPGIHNPRLWFFAEENGRRVGALLLNDHAEANGVELLYMGLIPAARGRGLGAELVRATKQQAKLLRRSMVFVSVDANNTAAVSAYHAAGFQEHARKNVALRLF